MQLGPDAPEGCFFGGRFEAKQSAGIVRERAGGMLRTEPTPGPGSDP